MYKLISRIIDQYSVKSGTILIKRRNLAYIVRCEESVPIVVSIISAKIIGKKWTKKYVDSLPDAAFAIVYTDARGTKIRKLPHHNKSVKRGTENSSVDIPHLRNALARLPQIKDTPRDIINQARKHLERHAKALLKN